jgi:hypothetical protein
LAVVQGAEELAVLKIFTKRQLPKNINFDYERIEKLQEQNFTEVKVTLSYDDIDPPDEVLDSDYQLHISSEDPSIASIDNSEIQKNAPDQDIFLDLNKVPGFNDGRNWTWSFNISANFLGFAKVHAKAIKIYKNGEKDISKESTLPVSVSRTSDL